MLISIVVAFLFLSITVSADLIMPPAYLFWSPFTIAVFLANLIINFFIFGLAYVIFVERKLKKINKKTFLIALVLITIVGFIADSITLSFFYISNIIFSVIVALLLIVIFDFLICKYYLKLHKKKALILSIWMGVFTNPFLYLFFTLILSIFLTPFVPHNPYGPPLDVDIMFTIDKTYNTLTIATTSSILDYSDFCFMDDWSSHATKVYYIYENMTLGPDINLRKSGQIHAGDKILGFEDNTTYYFIYEPNNQMVGKYSFFPY